jgi:hypothetical protein
VVAESGREASTSDALHQLGVPLIRRAPLTESDGALSSRSLSIAALRTCIFPGDYRVPARRVAPRGSNPRRRCATNKHVASRFRSRRYRDNRRRTSPRWRSASRDRWRGDWAHRRRQRRARRLTRRRNGNQARRSTDSRAGRRRCRCGRGTGDWSRTCNWGRTRDRGCRRSWCRRGRRCGRQPRDNDGWARRARCVGAVTRGDEERDQNKGTDSSHSTHESNCDTTRCRASSPAILNERLTICFR